MTKPSKKKTGWGSRRSLSWVTGKTIWQGVSEELLIDGQEKVKSIRLISVTLPRGQLKTGSQIMILKKKSATERSYQDCDLTCSVLMHRLEREGQVRWKIRLFV